MFERRRHPRLSLFRGSLAGLCAPLSTLRGWPRGQNLAHDSGSMWIATPSSWWTCTTYFLPVSRRTRTIEIKHSPRRIDRSDDTLCGLDNLAGFERQVLAKTARHNLNPRAKCPLRPDRHSKPGQPQQRRNQSDAHRLQAPLLPPARLILVPGWRQVAVCRQHDDRVVIEEF